MVRDSALVPSRPDRLAGNHRGRVVGMNRKGSPLKKNYGCQKGMVFVLGSFHIPCHSNQQVDWLALVTNMDGYEG